MQILEILMYNFGKSLAKNDKLRYVMQNNKEKEHIYHEEII